MNDEGVEGVEVERNFFSMNRFNLKTVQKLLTPPPGLTQRTQRLLHPTKYQWSLLRKLRGSAGAPHADRGVFKKHRQKACKSVLGIRVRRQHVKEAVREIDAAKKAEQWYITDERKRKVGGRPQYRASAPRRRKTASARDVTVWLAWKKIGKFGVRTITEDLRHVKK